MKARHVLVFAMLAGAIGAPIEALAEEKSVTRQTTPQRFNCPSKANCLLSAARPRWLNSPPLTPAGLRGKVVLVDVWTYTCINWLRTPPLRPRMGRQIQG